jgi:SAM-dependent methyltransferase
MTSYDDSFFRYVNSSATQAARCILPLLLREFPVRSVLDVGCGQGAWLAVWRQLNVHDVLGIDGSYVDSTKLLIPCDRFLPHDLRFGFALNRRFSIVQSLEVAEHLPEECAATFVASLVRHGDLILFSAAPKGQGGDNHINEQDYEYWRAHFARHGFVAIDFVRPQLTSTHGVAAWYRFNTLLYASAELIPGLPRIVRERQIPQHEPIRDVSPFHYRLRKRATRLLPVRMATLLARAKERVSIALAARQRREV